jgi:competence protein ComEA
VDQSTPSWRVFDAPASGGSAVAADPQPTTAPPGVGNALGVQPVVLVGLVGALLIGAVAVAVAMSGLGGQVVEGPGGSIEGPGLSAAPDVGILVVDVSGAVAAPGLYRLPAGSRIGDAITAAGGFSPRVDVDRAGVELNLAAALTDGLHVLVPSRDEPAHGPAGNPDGAGDGGTALINLNAASQSELESLPGIGPVTAGKIIEARAQSPFARVEELRERGIVGEKVFGEIRALVTVG